MMRSLFLRIFLSFWAAMLLVLSATAAVAWYRFNQVQSVSIDTKALGNEAAARLLVGGLPALHDWIDEAENVATAIGASSSSTRAATICASAGCRRRIATTSSDCAMPASSARS